VGAPDWLTSTIYAFAVERTLKAGQTLFRTGARTVGLYQIVKGKVRLARVDRSGREAVLQVAGPGDTFAEPRYFHRPIIATQSQRRMQLLNCIQKQS
jgi:CRP-like cAMP-binding protein